VRFAGVHDETGLDVYAPNTQMFAGDSYWPLLLQTALAVAAAAACALPVLRAVRRVAPVEALRAE
jgi:hypothetical protein